MMNIDVFSDQEVHERLIIMCCLLLLYWPWIVQTCTSLSQTHSSYKFFQGLLSSTTTIHLSRCLRVLCRLPSSFRDPARIHTQNESMFSSAVQIELLNALHESVCICLCECFSRIAIAFAATAPGCCRRCRPLRAFQWAIPDGGRVVVPLW